MGKIVTSLNYSQKTKKYSVSAKVENKKYKDTEIIPFHPEERDNDEAINTFLSKYIIKPLIRLDNTVGVEVNFNKEFYVPETVEPVDTILAEIGHIEDELGKLENNLGL